MTTEELINLVKTENPYTFGYTPKKNPYITKGEITYIGLSQNKFTIIDTEDLPKVEKHKWFAEKTGKGDRFYVQTYKHLSVKLDLPKRLRMHRIILPNYKILDHINRNGLDNRKVNLREASPSLNNLNLNSKASSGYLGVHKDHKGWAVKIQVKGKETYFGRFKTPEEAAVVAKRERERIIKELEQELAQNTSSCPPQPITP